MISSQELKRMVTLTKMEHKKSAMPSSGFCFWFVFIFFTKSKDVHVRTERQEQESKRSMQFLHPYPHWAVF